LNEGIIGQRLTPIASATNEAHIEEFNRSFRFADGPGFQGKRGQDPARVSGFSDQRNI